MNDILVTLAAHWDNTENRYRMFLVSGVNTGQKVLSIITTNKKNTTIKFLHAYPCEPFGFQLYFTVYPSSCQTKRKVQTAIIQIHFRQLVNRHSTCNNTDTVQTPLIQIQFRQLYYRHYTYNYNIYTFLTAYHTDTVQTACEQRQYM